MKFTLIILFFNKTVSSIHVNNFTIIRYDLAFSNVIISITFPFNPFTINFLSLALAIFITYRQSLIPSFDREIL